MSTSLRVEIRALEQSCIDQVLELEQFNEPFQWQKSSYQMAFRHSWKVMGAYCDAVLCSVMVCRTVADECSLMNLFVAPEFQGKGIAKIQLDYLVDLCRHSGCHHIFLEVRHTNQAALRLYEQYGFQQTNRRTDYYRYEGKNYDAIDMAMSLTI